MKKRAFCSSLCQRKQYDYLPVVELAVAAAEAADVVASETPKGGDRGWNAAASTGVEGLLRRYENALMLAHCEDAVSDAALLTEDDSLQQCRPILLNALRDVS